jgi:hypothetical protein
VTLAIASRSARFGLDPAILGHLPIGRNHPIEEELPQIQ